MSKPSDFAGISEKFARAKKGAGRARWAERKWKLSEHRSRSKAEGMIPGESLRSFLGEGASEKRERVLGGYR